MINEKENEEKDAQKQLKFKEWCDMQLELEQRIKDKKIAQIRHAEKMVEKQFINAKELLKEFEHSMQQFEPKYSLKTKWTFVQWEERLRNFSKAMACNCFISSVCEEPGYNNYDD